MFVFTVKDTEIHLLSNHVDTKWKTAARVSSHPTVFKLTYVFYRDFFLSSTARSASLETFSRVYLWLADFSWDLRGPFLVETYLFLLRNLICEVYPLQCYNLTENSFYKRNEFIWTLKFVDWKYSCDTWVGFALMCWFKGILNLQRHFCFCVLLFKFRDIWRSNIIFKNTYGIGSTSSTLRAFLSIVIS